MDYAEMVTAVSAVNFMVAYLMEKIPQFKSWFDKYTPAQKQLAFVVLNLAVVVGLTLYDCRITVGISAKCVTTDVWGLVLTFLSLNGIGLGVSQGTHQATK